MLNKIDGVSASAVRTEAELKGLDGACGVATRCIECMSVSLSNERYSTVLGPALCID